MWNSLASRLDNLPLILAGPVLRRTEAHSVTVWLALRQPGSVTLNVYQPSANDKLCLTGKRTTVKMGDNLYLVAVTAATVNSLLTEGITYCYDLDFEGFLLQQNTVGHLATPKIFSSDGSLADICYNAYPLPSFIMPPSDLKRLHILHGSCRKPHGGEGEQDALPYADAIIGAYVDGDGYNDYVNSHPIGATTDNSMPLERPHQFYHTGDQIYADDVAETLLFMLDDASKSLFGWVESLAVLEPDHLAFANEGLTEPLPQDPDFVANTPDFNGNVTDTDDAGFLYNKIKYSIQPGQRIDVAQKLGGLSSDLANGSGSSHLMRLGEYSCMYLFAWSDVLWPPTSKTLPTVSYPTFKQVMPWARATTLDEERASALKQKYDAQLETMASFRQGLKKVRRVLANIPSYMMCDDHEVTDDWFIGNEWTNRVYYNPLGRRIIQNGIAAFALFQAWGNKPADFETTPADTQNGVVKPASVLLDLVSQLAADRGQTLAKWDDIGVRVLPKRAFNSKKEQGNSEGRETSELLLDGVPDYSFCISYGKYALLAINSRTERGLVTTAVPRLGPALLTPNAMRRQVTQPIASLPPSVEVLLVLCPAPVFGHAVVEGFAQQAMFDLDNALVTHHNPVKYWKQNVPIADTDLDEGTDREGWSFHPECMQSLLKELSRAKKVILFSGDVHYGFSPAVTYRRRLDANDTSGYPEKASFIQLVGSAMKNATQTSTVMLAGNISSRLIKETPQYFAGWDKPGLHNYTLKYFKGIDGNPDVARDEPTDTYKEHFYFSELLDPVADLVDPVNDPPRWTYAVRYAVDKRSLIDRFTYNGKLLDDKYSPHPYPPFQLLQTIRNIVWTHRGMGQNIAVGHNQITQFKLNLDAGKVYHNFWFKRPNTEQAEAGPVTQHTLLIAPV